MLRFLPYLCKSLWRHRARTLLTVSGTAVALFVFCFVNALQSGLSRITENDEAKRTLVVFQESRFCPQSSRLPQDYAETIRKRPGVMDVIPIKVFTNNCRASLDSIVFQAMPAEKLRSARQLSIVAGSQDDFFRGNDGALVGRAVAARRSLKPGEKFTIGEISVQVSGVFASTQAAEEALIYTHLDFLQRARGPEDVGVVTQFEVHLSPDANVEAACAAIDEQFRSGPVATTTRTKGLFQAETVSDLAELIGFVHWLGYACVGLVLSLVATTTVMSVQDRIKEHAVLQTLGCTPCGILALVMSESTLLSACGGLLGIAIGNGALALGRLSIAAEGVALAFEPSFSVAMIGAAVSALVGLLAGVTPGLQAASTSIVAAMRSG